MRLVLQDLRSKVGNGSYEGVVLLQVTDVLLAQTKVGELNVTLLVQQDILWLKISEDDLVLV